MPSLPGILRKLRWSLAQRGALGSVRFAFSRLRTRSRTTPGAHPFDQQHGVDTSGLIGGSELVTGHPHDRYNTAYYGMSPSRFRGAIERWKALPPVAPTESYTFVDLGCGKGRAVMMATCFPFVEVVGVELNPKLASVAKKNLPTWRQGGSCNAPVRICCEEATEFEFPAGPCLLYLFNPFAQPVVERLLDGLTETFGDRPGLLDIVYFNPEAAEAFESCGGFRLLWSGSIDMNAEDAAADLVAGPDDLVNLYRWVGRDGR